MRNIIPNTNNYNFKFFNKQDRNGEYIKNYWIDIIVLKNKNQMNLTID